MELGSFASIANIDIIRIGQFNALGLLSHRKKDMLVGFYDPTYLNDLITNPCISCVITNRELKDRISKDIGVAIALNPMAAFYSIHEYLLKNTDFYWKNFKTEISSTAQVHKTAYIASNNVRIGENCIVEPHATVLERSIIDRNVIIRAGAVIGSEGFEPKDIDGKKVMVPHSGGVYLHDNVEVQTNSNVVRSVFGGFTEVGVNTKIDAFVHVGHNVTIGENSEIAACSMIAGSTTIGNHVFVGPNASISSELNIGDYAHITIGAVVTTDVKEYQRMSGNFAIEHPKLIKFIKTIR